MPLLKPITPEDAEKDIKEIGGQDLIFPGQETESERLLREAQTERLKEQGEIDWERLGTEKEARRFSQEIDKAALDLRREQMNLDASLQKASLDLQAKVKRGELTLQAALGQQDRLYKQAVLQQNERIGRGQALAQARQLQLQAAPWMVKKGQQHFAGFEPTGLASQIAQRFGMKFDAPEIAPIEFTPLADVEKTFAGANLEIPDALKGLDFSFISPAFAGLNMGGQGLPGGGSPSIPPYPGGGNEWFNLISPPQSGGGVSPAIPPLVGGGWQNPSLPPEGYPIGSSPAIPPPQGGGNNWVNPSLFPPDGWW